MNLRKDLNQLLWIIVSVLSFSFLFTGLRLLEIILHRKYLLSYPLPDILIRLIYSLSIDFIFFLILSSPYITFYLLCEYLKKDRNFIFRKIVFHIIYFPLILLFFLDMQTLAVQDRLFYLYLLSAVKIEMLMNLWVFAIDYWYLVIVCLAASFIVFKYLPFLEKKSMSKRQVILSAYVSSSLVFLFCLIFIVFKSLPFQREYRYNGLLMRLVNTIYTAHWACEKTFFSKKEVVKNLRRNQTNILKKKTSQPENIILFVIESLSMRYVQPDLMPFLSNLGHKGIFLKNHLIPVRATILSIHYLLTGKNNFEPPIDTTFMHDFSKAGYSLSFFFGDKKTTFDWVDLLKKLGISYIAREDYLKETGRTQDLDKEGNVFEKPFLQFSAKKIKNQKPPFFSIIVTNQVHYPFYCSPSTKMSYSTEKKMKDCVRYLDSALKDFFKDIETSIWFKDTLFVFTADHSNPPNFIDPEKQTFFHQFNVPLILYHPSKNLKKYQNEQISSHADIIPSLKDYLDLTDHRAVIHNSIFDLESKRRFFVDRKEGFLLIEDNYLTEYSCRDNQSRTYFKDNKTPIKDQKTRERLDKLIKSYIQYEHTLKKEIEKGS